MNVTAHFDGRHLLASMLQVFKLEIVNQASRVQMKAVLIMGAWHRVCFQQWARSPDASGETALVQSCWQRELRFAGLLSQHGAD